jgi:hypothetical protein
MSRQQDPRSLTPVERSLLLHVLSSADFVGCDELRNQVDRARVVGGIPTLLDLEVAESVPPSSFLDGPIPPRVLVQDTDGRVTGEILIWVSGGYLSGLEQAWLTDEAPSEFPPPSLVRIEDK